MAHLPHTRSPADNTRCPARARLDRTAGTRAARKPGVPAPIRCRKSGATPCSPVAGAHGDVGVQVEGVRVQPRPGSRPTSCRPASRSDAVGGWTDTAGGGAAHRRPTQGRPATQSGAGSSLALGPAGYRCGSVSTHCRTGRSPNTPSTRGAARSPMRRPQHDGLKPRPLQERRPGSRARSRHSGSGRSHAPAHRSSGRRAAHARRGAAGRRRCRRGGSRRETIRGVRAGRDGGRSARAGGVRRDDGGGRVCPRMRLPTASSSAVSARRDLRRFVPS
jgi:hypothetical protein